MPAVSNSIRIMHPLGAIAFFVVWIILFEGAHVLITFLRHGPLIGWAVSPWGITVLFLHEPSMLYIWLNVLFPALISGSVLYIGLFSTLSPLTLPHDPLVEVGAIVVGVLLTSTLDFVNALRDVHYPLWGEGRILRSIHALRASCASIHFTPFGLSYLHDHFGANPAELLRAM
jgi:hypothetical protein